MPVISLSGELVNLLPKGGDHYNGLSGVRDMVIVTGTANPQGYTTTEKAWSIPNAELLTSATQHLEITRRHCTSRE